MLRGHCEREGRNFAEIEKTCYHVMDPGDDGENVGRVIDDPAARAEIGIQTAIGAVRRVADPPTIELIGEQIIPKVAGL